MCIYIYTYYMYIYIYTYYIYIYTYYIYIYGIRGLRASDCSIWLSSELKASKMPVAWLLHRVLRLQGAGNTTALTQRIHVPKYCILKPQSSLYIGTLGPKYILFGYMDPLGNKFNRNRRWAPHMSMATCAAIGDPIGVIDPTGMILTSSFGRARWI